MSHDVFDKISFELIQMHRLLYENNELIIHAGSFPPTGTERSALALMLQSFYTGIENIFNRISIEIDGGFKKTSKWHVDLLESMSSDNRKRPRVISDSLKQRLHLYLGFRHLSRSIYAYDLHWDKMRDLVADCDDILKFTQTELESFMEIMRKQQ